MRKPGKDKSDQDGEDERPFGRGRGFGFGPGRGPGRGGGGHEHRERGDEERGRHRGFFAPHGSGPAENAMHALMTTSRMIHRFAESRIAEHKRYNNLSRPRMGVLFMVHHSGGMRMGDLAAKLCVAPRTVTDLVDGLERDGYLHRVPDPNDRRASRLELSALAKKELDNMSAMRTKFIEEIFSPLNDEEKTSLMSLLNKLREGPIWNRDFDSE